MTNDALERLRNKAKPKVESRDLTVSNFNIAPQDSKTAVTTTDDSLAASSNRDVEISQSVDISTSRLSNQNEQSNAQTDFATKQTTIRLEKQILHKISQVCQESEISREVLLEALFVNFENNKSVRSKIIKEAQKRDERRKEIANQRRAKSMIQRYG